MCHFGGFRRLSERRIGNVVDLSCSRVVMNNIAMYSPCLYHMYINEHVLAQFLAGAMI